MREVLRQMISDSPAASLPAYTRRDIRLPAVPGKAVTVIGMRRSGKTTFLRQCFAKMCFALPKNVLIEDKIPAYKKGN